MRKIELYVEVVLPDERFSKVYVIRYEWFGLKNQAKRNRRYVEVD